MPVFRNSIQIAVLLRKPGERKNIGQILNKIGYSPLILEDVEIDRHPFDLAIVDHYYAQKFQDRLIGLKQKAEIFLPIIVLLPRYASISAWLDSGYDEYIKFPVEIGNLRNRIRVLLALREKTALVTQRGGTMFEALVEQSLVGVYMFRGDRFLYVNEALARMFGYQVEDLMGKKGPMELTHSEDREKVRGEVEKRLQHKTDFSRYQFRGIRRDGTTIHCEVFGRRIEYMGEDVILGTLVDITPQKILEEELLRSAENWQRTFDAIGDAVSLLTPDRVLLHCNRAMARLLERPVQDLIGYRCCALVHGRDEPIPGCPFIQMVKSRSRASAELYLGDRCFMITVDPILKGSDLIGGVHIMADITKIKKAELVLKRHKSKLEEDVAERTRELRRIIDLMAGRELRMAELKRIIRKLQKQLIEAGLRPVVDDLIDWK